MNTLHTKVDLKYTLIREMKIVFTTAFVAYHGGNAVSRILSATMLSVFVQPVVFFINKYLFSNWETATMVLIALCVDLFIRAYVQWRQKKLSYDCFHLFFDKIVKYGTTLFVMNIFGHFIVLNNSSVIGAGFDYLNIIVQSTMFVAIILSIFESMAQLGHDHFPPVFIISRLKKFTETGNIDNEVKKNRRSKSPVTDTDEAKMTPAANNHKKATK